jgi:hypothetical protein
MADYESDHDKLIRIDANVDLIKNLLEKYDENMERLEGRIGKAERFQSRVFGVAAAASLFISIVWTQLEQVFRGGV